MKTSNFKNTITTLFGFTAPTYYRWKKEKRPIVNLLEKYFSDEELNEFTNTGKINRLEKEKLLDEGVSNYYTALKAVATATNKEEELLEDIKQLMKKYIG